MLEQFIQVSHWPNQQLPSLALNGSTISPLSSIDQWIFTILHNEPKVNIKPMLNAIHYKLSLLFSNLRWSGNLLRKPKELPIDLSQGGFNLPLQYAVWKRMFRHIEPVPTLLTLDPLTANSHLILSRDGTEVRVGDRQDDIPDNPERFSRWLSVLGSEGFMSGMHTWEVEVGESTIWQVGVAKASVPRKRGFAPFHWQESRKFFTPEPQAGVWALALQDGDYTALTSPPIELRLKGRLRKLGVYLDYSAGLVSFYNADDMSHLYTFTDNFTEAIYPYFYIAHKGDSLRLITLGI
ncbi:zinc-binding protein A33-like [Heterodontus francisci]|uniref:zinc-binding protein A33-like n=1 Tax=Heterodontus francisci TaxID=7792 RepID=UPI00355BDCE5